jgi:hypothetical protein
MKVLFSALHFAYLRNFESVVRALAARGHQVHLLADEAETFGGQALAERLAAAYPGVSWGWAPSRDAEPWFPAAQKLRYALDYVRFLDSRYQDAPKLRLRNIERTPRLVRWAALRRGDSSPVRRPLIAALKWVERSLPVSRALTAFFDQHKPDVVLLASLTYSRSSNLDQLKVARAAGIPVAACVMSWDHLSSKALLHVAPDLTIVGNDVQKREAIELHGIDGHRVAVTGAQCYDQWFTRRPERTREEFCAATGLDPARPFVLYVCSAMSPVPDPVEPVFVRQWLQALRASGDPVLRDAGVLVRPHPERVKEWSGISLDGFENVAVHGANPIDAGAKADYFESLYYSAAVAGLCTSAVLEAAIVGRPVLAPVLPAYRIHQQGMAHFRYLLEVAGGLLITAPTLDEHLGQLSAALAAPAGRDERNRRFVTAFVRPAGIDVEATPIFVDRVEQLAASRVAATARPARRPALQWLVGRVAAAASAGSGPAHWLMMDAIDTERAAGERERLRHKQAIDDGRAAYRAEEQRVRRATVRAKDDERRAKQRRKWRRALNPRKQLARLKGSVKQLIGVREP